MADKNLEIIKTIQQTGQADTPGIPTTKITTEKLPMFKRKKKKTGCETPELRKPTPPPPPPLKSSSASEAKCPKLPNDQTVTCLIKRGTTTEWEVFNPILYLNELAVEYNGDSVVGYKLGDGIRQWSDLDYITNINDIKEFWLYCAYSNSKRYLSAKIVLDPFIIKDFLKENN